MKQVIKYKDVELLNMIRRTDPMIQICRIGYSGKIVQALTQNLVHHTIVPTPDFTDYRINNHLYMYSGFRNPISLWNY